MEIPKQLNLNEILNEDERIFKSWATVEIVDRQGDLIPMNEFKKIMPTVMKRGGTLIDQHSNKPIGKILNYNFENHPIHKAEAMKLTCQVYKDYKHDDEVWEDIKKGKKTGLSFGGLNRKLEFDYSKAEPSKILKALEGFEFSVVDRPANQGATITEVNYIAKSDKLTTEEKLVNIKKGLEELEEDIKSNVYKKESDNNAMEEVTKQKSEAEKPEDVKPESEDLKKPKEEEDVKKEEAEEDKPEMSEEEMIKALKAKGYMVSKETKKEESAPESVTEEAETPVESEVEKSGESEEIEKSEESEEPKEEISKEDIAKMVKEEISKALEINKSADTPGVSAGSVEGSNIVTLKTPKNIYDVSNVIKQIEGAKQ